MAGSLGTHATQRNAICATLTYPDTEVLNPMFPLRHRFLALTLRMFHNNLVDRGDLAHLNPHAPRAAAASGPSPGHYPCCKRPAAFAEEPVRERPARGVQ